ncbi:guanylate kinase [Kordia sp. YSTF-M3]|uniref:Guanylate kinase n=1 Tax=Kordia aestuariivivens TaxID=2759037 RepID=A0ABR7Q6J7_9FLAO|nr:guanylate kinase [Kordia aestuariivivens]MBC8754201.1 guanylate kinase [Kordia aestuariivivens]
MKRGKLIVFAAPSGAGKTTIVHHLLGIPKLNLEFSISAASREKRGTEIEGKDYYFLSPAAFRQKIKNKEFLEWEEVYPENYYGTLKTEVDRICDAGRNVIFDIDVVGALRIKRKFPEETLTVFVEPPSINELIVRLKGRKTESDEKIDMRVAKAAVEMATAPQFDVIVMNDDLDRAKAEAEKIVAEYLGIETNK